MLKVYSSLKFTNHYYCYLNNEIFIVKDNNVFLVSKEDKNTNTVIEKYKDLEVTDGSLLHKIHNLINDYLLNTIINYNYLINKYTELHKELNS